MKSRELFYHLLNEIQFLWEEIRMENVVIKSLLLLKSSRPNEQTLSYKGTNDKFLDNNFVQFQNCFKMIAPKDVHGTIWQI